MSKEASSAVSIVQPEESVAYSRETTVSDSVVMLTPSTVELETETFPAGWIVAGFPHARCKKVVRSLDRTSHVVVSAINPEGWFNTRDLARLDNGYLFIVGRTKEVIVRFGENVYPAEVEAVLNAHPAVVRSAVIGRTVEGTQGGEEVVAFVQLAPSSTTSEGELAQHSAQHLAPYKRPSQILFVSSMPLTPTGKVVKGELARLVQFVPLR